MSELPNVICPGQRASFSGHPDAVHVLRTVFSAYWHDAAPSTEVFYLHEYPIHMSETGCEAMEADVLALMNTQDAGRVTSVTFIGYSGCEMTPDQVTAADWRVITENAAAPAPAPEPARTPTPKTALTPEPEPAPAPAAPSMSMG